MLGTNSSSDTQPILKHNIYFNSFVTWTRESAGFLKYYLFITVYNRLYFSTEFLIYYFTNIFSGSIINHTGNVPHSCSLSTLSILWKENIYLFILDRRKYKRLYVSYMSLYLLLFLLNYVLVPIRRKRRQKIEDMVHYF